MFTRLQFSNNECSHSEYYSQYITPQVTSVVLAMIGKNRILASTDENFRDISLEIWDKLHEYLFYVIGYDRPRELGDYMGVSLSVLIAKEAARQIKSQ